LERNSI